MLLACGPMVLSGCFVFEEIDAGMEIMDAHTPSENKEKREQAKAQAQDGEKPATYQESVESWWKDAKSLSSSPDERAASDDPVVPCNHAGKQVYTRRSDCIARGGQPG